MMVQEKTSSHYRSAIYLLLFNPPIAHAPERTKMPINQQGTDLRKESPPGEYVSRMEISGAYDLATSSHYSADCWCPGEDLRD